MLKKLYNTILKRIPLKLNVKDIETLKRFAMKVQVNLTHKFNRSEDDPKDFLNNHSKWLNCKVKWPEFKTADLNDIFVKARKDGSIAFFDWINW